MTTSFLIAPALMLVPVAEIDLASSSVFVSKETRALIAEGKVDRLVCGQLPDGADRRYRTACLTNDEIERGKRLVAAQGQDYRPGSKGYRPGALGAGGARSLAASSRGPRN